jgi:pimeloyl-ACP methyl ester carboxylesterase
MPDDRATEARALSAALAEELGAVAAAAEATHRAIARRIFRAVGPVGTPVRVAHDAIADVTHAAVRRGVAAAATGVGELAARRGATPLTEGRRGAAAAAIAHGLRGAATAFPASLRVDGRAVDPEPAALAAAYPGATPAPVVLLHGLVGTEHVWDRGPGARLAAEAGRTPVLVRYSTGAPVLESAAAIADLLDDAFAAWPVPVEDVALVGHSMGGLVAVGAVHAGRAAGHAWAGRVRHVVTLGAPFGGSWLEQGADRAARALARLPETRALGGILERRSPGIRDLRGDGAAVFPPLEGVDLVHVVATMTRNPRHPAARLLGDGLVRAAAAAAGGPGRTVHLGGTSHLGLLRSPDVADALCAWLGEVGRATSTR